MTIDIANWALIIFNLLILGAGIYFRAYLKKKAETLATNENFNELLKQVEATTERTKSIESKINNDAWVIQQKWEIKKDFYIEMLAIYNTIKGCLEGWLLLEERKRNDELTIEEEQEADHKQGIAIDVMHNAMKQLQPKIDLIGVLFLSEEVLDSFKIFTAAESKRVNNLEFEIHYAELFEDNLSLEQVVSQLTDICDYMKNLSENFNTSYELFIKSAREDLNLILNSK